MGTADSYPGSKAAGAWIYHSPPISAEVKEAWIYTSTPPYVSMLKLKLKLKSKLIYDRQSVGQSVLVSGTHLGPATNFSFSLKFPLGSCRFVILYCLLWREDGPVIYCTIASGPCQSSRSWVEVPQNSRPYFTVSSETPPNLEGQVPVVISSRNGVAQLCPRALGSICRLLRLAGLR
jgi:hypothetical protein